MAIYPSGSAPLQSANAPTSAAEPIDVAAWTEEASQALNTLTITSPGGVRGTSVSLAIDLDQEGESRPRTKPFPDTYRPRQNRLLRRDSLDRREALLKGKEGSRRRVRWENDRLLNNPWAQPPLPSDWEVHPTYPRRSVPYYLAPLWDQEVSAHRAAARKEQQLRGSKDGSKGRGKVPKELRAKLKKAKAAKGLLRDLEEQVRTFVHNFEMNKRQSAHRRTRSGALSSDLDSSDEEIVFVGRSGKMRDMPPFPKFDDDEDSFSDLGSGLDLPHRRHTRTCGQERLILESPVDDRSAGFGRWLVYNIAQYYGLRTWSRTIGDPARREAYVGMPPLSRKAKDTTVSADQPLLPSPLWRIV